MSIIVWIIIGGLAGWVAGMIMKEHHASSVRQRFHIHGKMILFRIFSQNIDLLIT